MWRALLWHLAAAGLPELQCVNAAAFLLAELGWEVSEGKHQGSGKREMPAHPLSWL